jgi:hypothetical protein
MKADYVINIKTEKIGLLYELVITVFAFAVPSPEGWLDVLTPRSDVASFTPSSRQ